MTKKVHYTICVVEDEPRILRGIIRKIEASEAGFTIAGTASNGEDGLEIINREKPDLVFADIRMPVMDGLEMCTAARKTNPDLKMVILSGHDDFHYAKRALQLGVEDYLLKPLIPEDMTALLGRIKNELDKKKESDKSGLYPAILSGEIKPPFSPHIASLKPALLLLTLGNWINPGCIPEGDPSEIFSLMNSELTKLMISDPDITVWRGAGRGQWYLVLENKTAADIRKQAGDLLAEYSDITAPYSLTLVWTSPDTPDSLPRRSNRLMERTRYSMIPGVTRLLKCGSDEEIHPPHNSVSQEEWNSLVLSLENGDGVTGKKSLEIFFADMVENKLPLYSWKIILDRILGIISELFPLPEDNTIQKLRGDVSVFVTNTPVSPDFPEKMTSLFIPFLSRQQRSMSGREITEKIKKYLVNNYTNTLSLEELSRRFGFDKSYLTKIFRKYCGCPPIKYLTGIRIGKAMEILERDQSMDIKDIAKLSGYPDQHYFARVFRRETGLTPSEYRENNRKNQNSFQR